MTKLRRWLLLLLVGAATACGGLLNPEAGYPLPVDPGSVLVRVSDQSGAPLRDVYVQVGNIPNKVGSTYSIGQWTRADGTTLIDSIDAGDRTVTVTPPTGFAAGPAGSTRTITVIKGQTVTVTVQLIKT